MFSTSCVCLCVFANIGFELQGDDSSLPACCFVGCYCQLDGLTFTLNSVAGSRFRILFQSFGPTFSSVGGSLPHSYLCCTSLAGK